MTALTNEQIATIARKIEIINIMAINSAQTEDVLKRVYSVSVTVDNIYTTLYIHDHKKCKTQLYVQLNKQTFAHQCLILDRFTRIAKHYLSQNK